jgi:hypothetical protein
MHQVLSKMHKMYTDVRELIFFVLVIRSMFEIPQNDKCC